MRLPLLASGWIVACSAGSYGTADPPRPAPAARQAEERAVRATVEQFTKAFDRGDAKAIAALFADDARVVAEDGTVTMGRPAIESLFAAAFAERPGAKIEVSIESLRLLGNDVAEEEGRTKITPAGGGTPETGRYSVFYVKRDGKWQQASVREMPDRDPGNVDHLAELEWMLGEWVDESSAGIVRTTCEWAENKSFLLRSFVFQVQGKPAKSGTQRIGWDPLHKQFRSWVFDSEGGFGEGFWTRAGDRWILKSSGVLRDGRTVTATQIVTPVNKNRIHWHTVDRTLGGEALVDLEELVLVRRPPKPK